MIWWAKWPVPVLRTTRKPDWSVIIHTCSIISNHTPFWKGATLWCHHNAFIVANHQFIRPLYDNMIYIYTLVWFLQNAIYITSYFLHYAIYTFLPSKCFIHTRTLPPTNISPSFKIFYIHLLKHILYTSQHLRQFEYIL